MLAYEITTFRRRAREDVGKRKKHNSQNKKVDDSTYKMLYISIYFICNIWELNKMDWMQLVAAMVKI